MTDLKATVDAPRRPAPSLTELATQIKSEYAEIQQAEKETQEASRKIVERAIKLGKALNQAKGQVPHGAWLPWLKEYCPEVSERTAQRYMRLAERELILREKMKFKN
jgi:hypothetical protein